MQSLEKKMGPETERSERKMKLVMGEVSIHSTTQPFNKHLWNTYCVPDPMLGSAYSAVTRTEGPTLRRSSLCDAHVLVKATRD